MFGNRGSWIAIVILVLMLCVSCRGDTIYENVSAGFSISHPADWPVDEIPESNQVSFGWSRVTVEIESAEEILKNGDVLSYLENMASINLESGRFIKEMEKPHIIRIGEYQAARMRVIWVTEFLVHSTTGERVIYVEGDVQLNVITNGDRLGFITVYNPDDVTDKMVKSFSFN